MTGIILVTCSGISSTGRLTFYAANYFMQRKPGVFEKQIPVSDINAREKEIFKDLKIVVFEGCTDCCSCKKLKPLGIEPDAHIIATNFEIEKRGTEEPSFEETNIILGELKKAIKNL